VKTLPERLPDDVIESFRDLAGNDEDVRWARGDFIATIVDEAMEELRHTPDEKPRVARWVIRELARETGGERDDLSRCYLMADFYPPDVRSKYIPPLTFHKLRACRSAGEQWQKYADLATDDLSITCEALWAMVSRNGDEQPRWLYWLGRAQNYAERLANDETAPLAVREAARDFLEIISI